MTIRSYFYDSINGDRQYSASDFSKALDVAFETGVLIREHAGNRFGFDIGGTNFTTIYEGNAVVEGRFVEVTGTEVVAVPSGTYSGQIVIQVNMDDTRDAKIIMKINRTPVQTSSVYELPLYDANVTNGIITSVVDVRHQGGAVPNNHEHTIADVKTLQTHIDSALTWTSDPNGVKCNMGKFAGTGKPIMLYLTTAQPSASTAEHRVWIQIDNF